MHFVTIACAAMAVSGVMAKDGRTFAVMHFYGNGPLTAGRMDPIISPGTASGHHHTIQGGSNFGISMTDTQLLTSSCTSARIKNDKSNYWTPSLFFQDPKDGTFTPVPMFYMNVYYFFEGTDDQIKAFPTGLRMVTGDASLRTPPSISGINTNTAAGPIQPIQWTCPRKSSSPPTYPTNSNGMNGVGISDNGNDRGVGFPQVNCDGYASPLRADIHFPSCYNPAVGIHDYKNNMKYPSTAGTSSAGKENCPPGWIHTPHLFYEVYWNTPLFANRWTPGQGKQPFVLANGDPTGYSLHGDFISGWDVNTLQTIIDTCDAGDSGMDKCPNIPGGLQDTSKSCNIPATIPDNFVIDSSMTVKLQALPGNNPVVGAGGKPAAAPAPAVAGQSTSSTTPSPTQKAAAGKPATTLVTSAATKATPASSPQADKGSDTTTTPNTNTGSTTGASLGGWTSAGCYADQLGNSRALTGIKFANVGSSMTTSKCIAYCSSKGYSIAGTEFGGQCFCDNKFQTAATKLDASKCAMKCQGDATQTCGGSNALTVYTKPGTSIKSRRGLAHAAHWMRHAGRRIDSAA